MCIFESTGNNYTYSVSILNFENGTCNALSVVDLSGRTLINYDLLQTSSGFDIICSANIVSPNVVRLFRYYSTQKDVDAI